MVQFSLLLSNQMRKNWCYLVTARKRSLGQGNVFTHVYHSVWRGVGLCHKDPPPPSPRTDPAKLPDRGNLLGSHLLPLSQRPLGQILHYPHRQRPPPPPHWADTSHSLDRETHGQRSPVTETPHMTPHSRDPPIDQLTVATAAVHIVLDYILVDRICFVCWIICVIHYLFSWNV